MNTRFMHHLAVTAVFAVTASLYLNSYLIFIIFFYFLFVFSRFPLRYCTFLFIFFVLFAAYVLIIDRMNVSALSGKETVFSLQFTGMPSRDGDRLSGFARMESGEKLWVTYTIKS